MYISCNSSIADTLSIAKPAEFTVLTLFFILIVMAASLTLVLWAGTFFFQGYIYTEPSAGIYWQAPAAAALLTFGYTIWCLTIALYPGASPQNIPIDAIHRFNPYDDMSEFQGGPAPKVWAILLDRKKTGDDKDGEKILYVSKRDSQTKYHYETPTTHQRWPIKDDLIAIEIEKPDGTLMHRQATGRRRPIPHLPEQRRMGAHPVPRRRADQRADRLSLHQAAVEPDLRLPPSGRLVRRPVAAAPFPVVARASAWPW